MVSPGPRVCLLSGGVGGAKLALGFYRALPPGELAIVVNSGDDFTWMGLRVCPDLDTVLYTLAGLANPETGWGLAGETWNFLEALGRLGGPTWFRIGDRDLATHVWRTARLRAGAPLSAVAAEQARRLGVDGVWILPPSDDPVETYIRTPDGVLSFQEWLVKEGARPAALAIEYRRAGQAAALPAARECIERADVVVIAPSNPFVSIDPILAVPGMREALAGRGRRTVAVSPIVGGRAVKGPLAEMLRERGLPVSPASIAHLYRALVDVLVIDERDATLAPEIERLGIEVRVTDTVMVDDAKKEALARFVLSLV